MSLQKYSDDYDYFTSKLGELVRKLAYVGIAIVWIFKIGDADNFTIPKPLLWAMLFCAFTLIFDVLQYAYSSILYGIIGRAKEKQYNALSTKKKKEVFIKELGHHPACNWPSLVIFWLKPALILIAYAFIAYFLIQKLSKNGCL